MFQQLIYVFSVFIAVSSAGEFIVISSPKGIAFKGDEEIELGVLKDVYTASLGFSVEESNSWTGMYLNDPFNLADAIVNVVVDGVNTLEPKFNQHFSLRTNNDLEENTFDALEKRILNRYPSEKNIMLRALLNQGVNSLKDVKIFSDIRLEKVDSDYLVNDDVTKSFLEELRLLQAISSKVKSSKVAKGNSRDVYWFVLSGLKDIADYHGDNSTEISTAKNQLYDTLNEMNSAFQKAYNNRALVTVMTSTGTHARIARSLKETEEESKGLNLADNYDPVYPVIFNIILWFSVIMFFSILAISIAIGGMDPGRDSIIYRMTSNRMKKDN